jgi:hypothetical protein
MRTGSLQEAAQLLTCEFAPRDPRTLVLRAGLLEQSGKTSFCLVKDMSQSGLRAKLYSGGFQLGPVIVRIADAEALGAQIVWIADGHAGITFDHALDGDAVCRLGSKPRPNARRSVPRVTTAARAIVRSGGRSIAAELCDISSFGAKVRTRRSLKPDRAAVVDIPDLPSIRAYVRWSDGQDSGLEFATPIPMQVIGHWIDQRLRVSA